jgi:uncharacterized protein (TIGR02246 family)
MKGVLTVALAGLAITFTAPVFAQQKDTVDPKIEQQIRALMSKYDNAINRHDAAAVAALYTQDGVSGTSGMPHFGTFHGRQAIEKGYAQFLQSYRMNNHITSVDRVSAVGSEIRSTGRWSAIDYDYGIPTNHEGYYSSIVVSEGGTWKIRKSSFGQSNPGTN